MAGVRVPWAGFQKIHVLGPISGDPDLLRVGWARELVSLKSSLSASVLDTMEGNITKKQNNALGENT